MLTNTSLRSYALSLALGLAVATAGTATARASGGFVTPDHALMQQQADAAGSHQAAKSVDDPRGRWISRFTNEPRNGAGERIDPQTGVVLPGYSITAQ